MRLWLGVGIVGIGLGAYGFQELRLTRVAQAEPQTLSCKELASQGPGSNAHVRMTDFLAAPGSFVYEERKGTWTAAWIPIVPLDSDYARELAATQERDATAKLPLPKDIRIVAKLPKARNQADVVRMAEGDTLTGLVVNEISRLDGETRKLLKESYPEVDFERCWILEEGRTPASTLGALALMGAGLGLLGLAVWLFLRGRRPQPA
jgi:hypothetical protein